MKAKKIFALAISAAMALSLAACGGSSSSSSKSESASTSNTSSVSASSSSAASDASSASTDSSVRKVLRFGEQNAKVGYDPQTNTNSGATAIEDCVVENLFYWNDQNEEVPILCEDFPEVSDDGLTYTFKLREGIKFSDGTDLTSDDVKFTFERMFTPETGATSTYMYTMIKGAQEMLDGEATELEGFEKIDDYTFTFTLTAPNSIFVKNLGIAYAAIFPSEACSEAGADWGVTTLIGTGPYTLDFSQTDDSQATLLKNENYWGDEPHFDEIDVVYYDDENTKMMAFENGDIDLCQVSTALYLTYMGSEVAEKFYDYYPLGTIFLNVNMQEEFNGEKNPLADLNVRKAISLAIDRQTLVDIQNNGLGTVATGFINPYELGYDDTNPEFEYDPAAAEQLLIDAGYTKGSDGYYFSFETHVRSGRDQEVGDMTVVKDDLAKIGINMILSEVDSATWTEERAAGTVQSQWMGWFPLYADADNNVYSWFHSSNSIGKASFYNNPEFDKLMDDARLTTDDEERAELYKQADKILSYEDYAAISLYYPTYVFAAQDYVKNFTVGNLIYQLQYDIDFDMDIYTQEKG